MERRTLVFRDGTLGNTNSRAFKLSRRRRAIKRGSTVCIPYVPSLNTPFHSKLAASLRYTCRTIFNYPDKLKSNLVSNVPSSDSLGIYRVTATSNLHEMKFRFQESLRN